MDEQLEIEFEPEKETKWKWRFQEIVPDDGVSEELVGQIYVPKRTLRLLGWVKGRNIRIVVESATISKDEAYSFSEKVAE